MEGASFGKKLAGGHLEGNVAVKEKMGKQNYYQESGR